MVDIKLARTKSWEVYAEKPVLREWQEKQQNAIDQTCMGIWEDAEEHDKADSKRPRGRRQSDRIREDPRTIRGKGFRETSTDKEERRNVVVAI